MWNVADPAHPSLVASLAGPASHVYSVAFSPSGTQLAATSYEGTVHLWDTGTGAASAAVCANLGQPITTSEWATLVPGVPYRAPCG
jgi:WD40 repeat protein